MTHSRARTLARRLLFPPVEAAWTALFKATGLLIRPRARLWSSTGGEQVLIIAPHPDDETLGCGGVSAHHRAARDTVHIAVVTDGGGSRAGGLDRERMVQLRRGEAERAVAFLSPQIKLTNLGLPEGLWDEETLVPLLLALLEHTRPHLIYAPSCIDFHPEHLRVAAALARVLSLHDHSTIRAVRAYEVQVPLTPLLANLISPLGNALHTKHHALRAYRTQLPALQWWPRLARYWGALYRLGGPAEAFWEMPPLTYADLMSQCAANPSPYRGLRVRPFTDGFAWLKGLRSRALLQKRQSVK